MSEIASIEYRRIQKKWSVHKLCTEANFSDTSAYYDYLSGKTVPPLKVLKRLMEAVGLRLYIADVSMDKEFNALQWAVMSMYIKAYPQETYFSYSKATTIRLNPDKLFYLTLTLSLFITFYYRSFGKLPSAEQCQRHFQDDYEISYLKNRCVEEDLLTLDQFPSSRAQSVFDQLAMDIDKYLRTANLMDNAHD